jgi:hypothetical protein
VDLANFLVENWAKVQAAPGPFITLGLLAVAFGATAAHFFYKHRIDTLKERIEALKEKLADTRGSASAPPDTPSAYAFPEAGFYGANILGAGVPEVTVNRGYSMAAEVPAGKKLRVKLKGPAPIYLEDNMGAWVYRLAPRNWIGRTYDQETNSQWFEADAGTADLEITPQRKGMIEIEVYEGGRDPTWTKTLRVRES